MFKKKSDIDGHLCFFLGLGKHCTIKCDISCVFPSYSAEYSRGSLQISGVVSVQSSPLQYYCVLQTLAPLDFPESQLHLLN